VLLEAGSRIEYSLVDRIVQEDLPNPLDDYYDHPSGLTFGQARATAYRNPVPGNIERAKRVGCRAADWWNKCPPLS